VRVLYVGEPQEQCRQTLVDDIRRAGHSHCHCQSGVWPVEKLCAPVVMGDACDRTLQTFVGNGKKVDLSVNSGVLRVVGNNCCVTIIRNEGQIMITGNRGHLQVIENVGCINYTGNHGLIEVGPTAKGIGRVVYTGNGGAVKRMKSDDGGKCAEGCSTQNQPPSKKEDVQNKIRVNGVKMCINSESKKDIRQGVTKENINPEELQSKSPHPVDCSWQESRKVWVHTSSKNGDQKNGGVKALHRRNIQLANPSDIELYNWCLNLATELFPV